MRKSVTWVLIGLGAFLLMAAVVASTWASGAVKKTPTDTDSTTNLTGQAEKLNPDTDEVEDLDVKVTSYTKADSKASNDDVVVFTNVTCVVVDAPGVPNCVEDKDDPNLISIPEPDVFATDRFDAQAVKNGKFVPSGTEQKSGLVNKFPFDTEKKSCQFWDGMLKREVPVKFTGTEKLHGVETYKFNYNVADQDAEVVSGIDGKYSMDKTMWVEPKTGAIIKQEQHEVRTLAEGDPLLDMQVAFTDEQVKANASDAEENVSSLGLITSTVPLVGFIGGPILLLIGGALLLMGQGSGRRAAE